MRRTYDIHTGNQAGIYVIRNLKTGTAYIGQTSHRFKIRCNAHISQLRRGLHVNPKLQRAWNKYGADAFVFDIVEIVADPGALVAREQFWLDQYRQGGPVFNLGNSSAAPRLGLKNSPDAILKSRNARRGQKLGPIARSNISNAQLERFRDGTHPRQGKKHRPDSIEKMRSIKLGKRHSDATKSKMAESHKGKVTAAKPFAIKNVETGEIVIGVNLAKFCRERGLCPVSMGCVARGKWKSHRGWQAYES